MNGYVRVSVSRAFFDDWPNIRDDARNAATIAATDAGSTLLAGDPEFEVQGDGTFHLIYRVCRK